MTGPRMQRDTYYVVSTLWILGGIVAPNRATLVVCTVAAIYNLLRMDGWL